MDQAKTWRAFVHKALGDLGSALTASLVVIGDKLGLYRAHGGRPGRSTSAELAARPDTTERCVREWLAAQAAAGYVDVRSGERALHAAGRARDRADRRGAARPACSAASRRMTGGDARRAEGHRGVPHRQGRRLARARSRPVRSASSASSGPGYNANLVDAWIPALDGVRGQARARAPRVADVGCGHGASTIIMAQGVPALDASSASTTTAPSIEQARERAARGRRRRPGALRGRHGQGLSRARYDLVAFFDCLHDMGDPVGAAAHVRRVADAGRHLAAGRAASPATRSRTTSTRSAASSTRCRRWSAPRRRSRRRSGTALGAQAGEARLREVVTQGRLHPLPPRDRDAVQPGARGATLSGHPGL